MDLVVFDHPSVVLHESDEAHPERPERVLAARRALDRLPRSALDRREAPQATRDELEAAHTPAHVATILALTEARGALDADTYVGPGSREAALRAGGGAVALGHALASGARRGFVVSRPPGHHAEADRAMGFCLLNNVALAARSAQRAGARRVAVVDWDAHHGNGTQEIFARDPDVLVVSLHQWPLYPGTGAPGEVGVGPGLGATANLAMPPGAGHGEYRLAFHEVVLPLLEEHRPDVILLSAGFDSHVRDPLAELRLDESAYHHLSDELVDLAERIDAGLGAVLEGGYDLHALEHSLHATLARMTGERIGVHAPHEVSPAGRRAVALTKESLAPFRSSLA